MDYHHHFIHPDKIQKKLLFIFCFHVFIKQTNKHGNINNNYSSVCALVTIEFHNFFYIWKKNNKKIPCFISNPMMTSCCPVRNEHKHQTSTHTHIPYTPYHTNHFQKQPNNNNNNNRVRRSMFHTGFFIQIIIIIFAYAPDSCNMTFTSPLLVGCIHSSIQFIHRI